MQKLKGLLLLITMVGLVAGCDSGGTANTPAAALKKVRIGMGYIPNVQFAAYYVAQEKGYYRQAGLDVSFDYGSTDDLLAQVAVGKLDFANSEGDELIVAASKGVKDVYVLAQYQRFPVAVFFMADSPIKTVADLKGKRIGLPGKYGANYNGLLAMLYANQMTEQDVRLQEVGYTQAQAVQSGQVDAAVGYAVNEPIALAAQGVKLRTLQASDSYNLASIGIITSQDKVAQDPTTVQAFVSATLHGIADMNADPDAAYAIAAKKEYANIDQPNSAVQLAVLKETAKFQQPSGNQRLGASDPAVWAATAKFLQASGLVSTQLDVSTLYTNRFVEASRVKLRLAREMLVEQSTVQKGDYPPCVS